jgi:hypothetical protein
LSASGPVYKTTYRFDVIALSGIQKIQFELDSEDGASLRKQSNPACPPAESAIADKPPV